MSITAAELVARVVADTGSAERDLRSFAARMGGSTGPLGGLGTQIAGVFGGTMLTGAVTSIGRGLTNLGRAGVGAFADLVTSGADFEMQMDAVAAVLGGTQEQADALGKLALGLAMNEDLKVNATEAAQAIQNLATAGLTADQILGGAAEATVLLANSTGGDFGQAATVATDVMKLFNINAGDMGEAINGIAAVSNASKFDLNDYALAIAQAGGVAALNGVSFEDFNATIAATSPAFASGSDAGTSFKTFLQRLQPTTKESAKLMGQLGLLTEEGTSVFYDAAGALKDMDEIAGIMSGTFGDMTEAQRSFYLSQIFGTDAMRTAGEMSKWTTEEFQGLLREMARTDAMESARVRTDNFASSLEALQGKIEGIKLGIWHALEPAGQAILEALMPAIDWAAPYLEGWAQQFGAWVTAQIPNIQAQGQAFAAAFGTGFQQGQTEGLSWDTSFLMGLADGVEALTGADSKLSNVAQALADTNLAVESFGDSDMSFLSSLVGGIGALTGAVTEFDKTSQTFKAAWGNFEIVIDEENVKITIGGQSIGTWINNQLHRPAADVLGLTGEPMVQTISMGSVKIDLKADQMTIGGKPTGDWAAGQLDKLSKDMAGWLDTSAAKLFGGGQPVKIPMNVEVEPKVTKMGELSNALAGLLDKGAATIKSVIDVTVGSVDWGTIWSTVYTASAEVAAIWGTAWSTVYEVAANVTAQWGSVWTTLYTAIVSLWPDWGSTWSTKYSANSDVAADWGSTWSTKYGADASVSADWGSTWSTRYSVFSVANVSDWINNVGRITLEATANVTGWSGNPFSGPGGPGTAPPGGGGGGQFNATGDPMFGGEWTWVGERGPELVRLPRASRIFNDRDSERMAGGRNVTINAVVQNPVDLELLAKRVQRLIMVGA